MYFIECNPRAHIAVVLFRGTGELAERYLEVVEVDGMRKENGGVPKTPHVVVPNNPANYYCVGHDLVTLPVLSTLQLLSGQGSLGDVHRGVRDFIIP